ncbi:MAG: hypothetical protein JO165_13810, partial [Candidatus Eremiobacteraeota bacterium]|nr:hypothetical protein [Candidatus Eremiobacteraeota bacterium]
QALQISVSMGDYEGEALALHNVANGLVYTFAVNDIRADYQRAHEIYERLQHQVGLASIAVDEAMFETEIGLLARAHAGFENAEKIAAAIDHRWILCVALIDDAYCERLRSETKRALECAADALRLAQELHSTTLESAALGVLGCAELQKGDTAGAIRHLRRGVELRRGSEPTPRLGDNLRALADALLAAGQVDEAASVATELSSLYESHPHLAPQPAEWLGCIARACAATGRRRDASIAWQRAAATVMERGARIEDDDTRAAFYDLPFNREATSRVLLRK